MRSACLVYGPDGERVARYDKIHLFAFARGEERYDEGRTIEAGRRRSPSSFACGRVGLSVCYDLRFPELYRGFGDLALILVPSAFTATTGAAHWHLLLRARAVENQCYVLAAAQGGTHPGGRRTYGHSALIDPWGRIVAEREEGPGIVVGDIEPCAHRRSARAAAGALPSRAERSVVSGVRISRFRSTDRYFEDYVPGEVCVYGEIAMTEAEIVEFARRYDPQPIHADPDAALQGPFGGLIASGWHTIALVMRVLVERYLSHVAAIVSPGIDELRWTRRSAPATCCAFA